jgi:hypothetical protein
MIGKKGTLMETKKEENVGSSFEFGFFRFIYIFFADFITIIISVLCSFTNNFRFLAQ